MPVEVHTLGLERQVHGLLVEGVGDGGVHLARHSELDGALHALEGGVAALDGDLAQLERGNVLDEVHVEHIDSARLEHGVRDSRDRVHADLGVIHESLRLLDHLGITHHDGAAALIERGVGESLDGDLGAVAGGVAHGNSDDGQLGVRHG